MAEPHPHAIDLGDLGNLTENSHEIMRVWVTDRAGSSAWIDSRLLDDPKVFGFLLADTVRHAANAYAETAGLDEGAALQAIVDGLVLQMRETVLASPSIQPGSLN
ncbi:MAG: DUF5076 domain-containing protein [Hyphomicrobiaceae bacterium]